MKMNKIYSALFLLIIFKDDTMLAQDCPSTHDLQSSIQQAQKLLSAQEASYYQNAHTLRKKLNLLHDSVVLLSAKPRNYTCPNLESPINGRILGKVRFPGHEVHFLCDSGFVLVGSETLQCKDSLKWSGQQPVCKDINECLSLPCANGGTCTDEVNGFSCVCAKGWAGPTCQSTNLTLFVRSVSAGAAATSSFPLTHTSAFIRQSRCRNVQGITHCTCEPGYTISREDNSICSDIDECKLFHNGQAGRLCLHSCVNTPGGYRCTCPTGYNVSSDGRNCKDFDECGRRRNNCTSDELCINTYGGFQCVKVKCPRTRNSTYVKTSPVRCERTPCSVDNKACTQAPTSVSYHYTSIVSNLSAPRVIFRMSAVRTRGDTLRFAILGNRGHRYFTVQRSDPNTGELMLINPVKGPTTLEVELEMRDLEKEELLGSYITKITIFVSRYEF